MEMALGWKSGDPGQTLVSHVISDFIFLGFALFIFERNEGVRKEKKLIQLPLLGQVLCYMLQILSLLCSQ